MIYLTLKKREKKSIQNLNDIKKKCYINLFKKTTRTLISEYFIHPIKYKSKINGCLHMSNSEISLQQEPN